MVARIASIYIYPIKSCKGISLPAAYLTPTGLRFDRAFMVVDAATGKFLTQRTIPKLALVSTSLPVEALTAWGDALPADAALTCEAPGMEALKVPLSAPTPSPLVDVECWEWSGKAGDAGDEAAAWFSKFLGQACRLVRYLGAPSAPSSASLPDTARLADASYAGEGHLTSFTDGFPILLISEPSLRDLNGRLDEPVKMNRFRPNLTVDGNDPWAEDEWQTVQVVPSAAAGGAGGAPTLVLDSVKPCSRCKVTTTNQETAEVSSKAEPLRTLGTYRRGRDLGLPKWGGEIFVGHNLVARASSGMIRVGDTVELMRAKR